ncbi:sugar-binding domain-containing protein [Sphingobacterium corticibacter]|uniref:Glycoside hydrolase family 2 n=1 Tax=Sphingobacterium corticibacter TaxID=2171749 RepID=A0A2T8HNG4_9SPHI|nr:sugar-binding domain-containing protein [Sphingobacterium corticibacter]PVH26955.1 glycoside hydrolase family 2 [Sphingobacterium corticibacter]
MYSKLTRFFVANISVCFLLLHSGNEVMAQADFGNATKLNKDWQFKLSDQSDAATAEKLDRSWRGVQLPHDWSVRQPLSPSLASATGYLPGGIGWYRKQVFVDADKQGQQLYIYFEGVYNRSEVFVNGHSLGKRPNGYVSFMYDLTPHLKYGAENTIAVRVDHTQDADSRWYTGSGIYRDVWLVQANKVHLEPWGLYVYPEVTKNKGTLKIETPVQNHSDQAVNLQVMHTLVDGAGKTVIKKTTKLNVPKNGKQTINNALEVRDPELWSLDNPTLYTLQTTVTQDGKVVDQSSVRTGFRTYTFDSNKGFALNGTWMKVKGVCLHHDAGVLGAAVYPEVWRRRLLQLKSMGVNAIRTSHNPQASSLYALCDELGMLVMNEAFDEWEFPKRKWLSGWNVGTPGFQGAFDYFKEWGDRDLADMVRRDRNHLSIFAWSIGNEVDYPNDPYSHPVLDGGQGGGFTQPIFGGYRKDAPDAMRLGGIAERLAAVVREHDKSRPVTAGLAGVAMSNETAYPSALDIAGYNYTESRYQEDHTKYPERVIYGSENRHDFGAWKAVRDQEHIFGQFLWTGIDYLGESGRWPSRGFYSGLLDFAGSMKPRGYFRASLWSDKPMAYLGTYPVQGGGAATDTWSQLEAEQGQKQDQAPSMDAWPVWNYSEGQQIRVVSYSNAAIVYLTLNGRKVGEEKAADDRHGIVYWDIPYAAGTLTVIGLDESGREIAKYDLKTSKRSYALKVVEGANQAVNADGGLAQISLQIVDQDGVVVPTADDEITCQIVGSGTLLGMEAGNNSDMSDYTDNQQRAFKGKMMVYVRADGKPSEEIRVRLTAPWLQAAEVKIPLK